MNKLLFLLATLVISFSCIVLPGEAKELKPQAAHPAVQKKVLGVLI